MTTAATPVGRTATHPVRIHVEPALDHSNRLTTAFRPLLAIPHLILVGAPIALMLSWNSGPDATTHTEWSAGGVFGALAAAAAFIGWFAILFTGRYPTSLYNFAIGVFRWNTRVEAYLLLFHDEYPPFSLD